MLFTYWEYQQVWELLCPLLFWKNNSMDLISSETTIPDFGTKG